MTVFRFLASVAVFAGAALVAGCGKKPEPIPEPAPNPDPEPQPRTKANPKQSPKRPPKTSPKQPPTISGAYNEFNAKAQLRKIGLAMLSVEALHGYYPAGIVGPDGNLGLSWRVAILPYLEDKESQELYKEFRLAEAWDSPHNKKLLARMPEVFATPGKAASEGRTYYRSFAGPTAIMPPVAGTPQGAKPGQPARGRLLADITDGDSNTLMVVEAAEPVEWTKPDELAVTDKPLPKLGLFQKDFLGIMCDSSVHKFPETVSEKSLRALISVNAGDLPGSDAGIRITPPKK
jgi:hypothetical protein